MTQKPILLEFTFSPRELQMAMIIAFSRSWLAWTLMALPLLAVLVKFLMNGFANPEHAKIYLAFCGIMELALLTIAPWRMSKVMTQEGGRFAGTTRVSFTHEGVIFDFATGQTALMWDQYARYCYRKGFLVLDLGRIISHCIPVRALDSDQRQQIDRFLSAQQLPLKP